jgi:REP element-mobilizing transposase RayT
MSYTDLRKGRLSVSGGEYFITTVVNDRRPVFRNFLHARHFIRIVHQLEVASDYQWLAWVLMPDHFHGLLRTGNLDLSTVMNSVKGVTAYRLNRELGLSGNFWQPGFYDRALRREEDRRQVARYLVANPLRAGLVSSIGDYPHWDSIWL